MDSISGQSLLPWWGIILLVLFVAFPCCCCCAAFLIYKVFKWNNCYFLRKIFFSFLSLNSVFPTKYSFSSRPSKKVFLFYKGCKWKCSSYTKSSNESPPTKLSFTFLLNLSLLQSLKVFLCYENLFFYKIFRFKFSFSLETFFLQGLSFSDRKLKDARDK